jgi:hypothetical protein
MSSDFDQTYQEHIRIEGSSFGAIGTYLGLRVDRLRRPFAIFANFRKKKKFRSKITERFSK